MTVIASGEAFTSSLKKQIESCSFIIWCYDRVHCRLAATTALLTAEADAEATAAAATATATATAAYKLEKEKDTQALQQLIHAASALCRTFGEEVPLAVAGAHTGNGAGKISPQCSVRTSWR